MNKANSKSSKLSQEAFVIDTNILINFSKWTPLNIHRRFWRQMEKAVEDKRLIIIEEVADEFEEGSIEDWIKERKKSDQIVTVEDEIKNRAAQIENDYRMISEKRDGTLKSEADPVIIAYAESHGYTVFTDESEGQILQGKTVANLMKSGETAKIPFVCNQLNVRCIREPAKALIKIMEPIH